jgi:hypothetical protein
MGEVLETGWVLVMENFQQLDRLLYSPHKNVQVEPNSQSNELNILSTALDSLFKSTEHLDDKALVYLLEALKKISTDALQNTHQVIIEYDNG